MSGWLFKRSRTVTLGALLLAAPFALRGQSRAGEPTKAAPPAVGLVEPENLSATTRAELRTRMARHGNVMSNLVTAVVLLDRPTITTLAGRIADEEVVARSESDGKKKWESRLPNGFFAQQDALRSAAHDLAASAVHGSADSTMADRFATVARTCVACHSIYLHGRAAGDK
jgi:hypothetical protein